jgi:hypothetical protein
MSDSDTQKAENPHQLALMRVSILVAWDGIEPSTRGFSNAVLTK